MNAADQPLKVLFTRKPYCLADVLLHSDPDRTTCQVEIEIIIELTKKEYDEFADNLLADRDWLRGRGGQKNYVRSVVMVTAIDRTTLFVDPSGSAYGRYVGVAV